MRALLLAVLLCVLVAAAACGSTKTGAHSAAFAGARPPTPVERRQLVAAARSTWDSYITVAASRYLDLRARHFREQVAGIRVSGTRTVFATVAVQVRDA